MSKQHTTGYVALVAFGALLLYLLKKSGPLLHESVSASIITSAGTITSDPLTGAPQFDVNNGSTYNAAQFAAAVPPLDAFGNTTTSPANPQAASCPLGKQLWHEVSTGTYWCM